LHNCKTLWHNHQKIKRHHDNEIFVFFKCSFNSLVATNRISTNIKTMTKEQWCRNLHTKQWQRKQNKNYITNTWNKLMIKLEVSIKSHKLLALKRYWHSRKPGCPGCTPSRKIAFIGRADMECWKVSWIPRTSRPASIEDGQNLTFPPENH